MKRVVIAGFAAGAAMMIGGALAAVSDVGPIASRMVPDSDVINPLVGGQAMLPTRTLLENIAVSPDHGVLTAAMRNSGISDALQGHGEFTVFAPTNAAIAGQLQAGDKARLARLMGYLVVPGKYDSQTLLKAIGEGGGQAKLRTLEGGILLAKMNGPTNVILMDEKGDTADIAIYDVYARNGVMHVIDHMPAPGAPARQIAAN